MTAPPVVFCARCQRRWLEDDPGVTCQNGDWWCANTDACDERAFENAQAGDHPDGF